MPDTDLRAATTMAALAASAGAIARVLILLHGGVREWVVLAIGAAVGGLLGVMAAGAAVWFDPTLRDVGWPLLIVASAAGCAGAVGTRLLDIAVEAIKQRVGA